jgi:hypothetical protein
MTAFLLLTLKAVQSETSPPELTVAPKSPPFQVSRAWFPSKSYGSPDGA